MELSRRQVLAATVGIALPAGCTGSGSNPRLLLDASVTKAPREPFTIDVEVLNKSITDSNPGKLAVIYHNYGNEPEVLNLEQAESHPRSSKSKSPGVVLEHPNKSIEQGDAGCWMPDDDSVSSTLGRPHTEIAPDEQVRADYKLWAHPQGKPDYSCIVPGTYHVQMPESASLTVEVAKP